MSQRDDEKLTRREAIKAGSVAAAGLVAACGTETLSETPPGPDAETPLDQGVDAAAVADSGTVDAGVVEDAGHEDAVVDAGAGEDAEPIDDAGVEDDAGVPVDAGTPDSGIEPPSANFPLGVASGDVHATSAILWTRYTGRLSIELVVYELANGVPGTEILAREITVGSGGYVHEEVTQLVPGAQYAFRFYELEMDQRADSSPLGRFRAAIGEMDMVPLTLGACSCTSNGRQFSTLEHAGARNDLDLFMLLGDTTYNDGATTLTEFRDRWSQNLSTDGYRALRASTSLLATWDDHEITNDWAGETVDSGLFLGGSRAFFDSLPLRRDPMSPNRVYKSVRWGLTAEIFVLDCRGERKPSTRNDAAAEYISTEQLDWLKAGLSSSPAVFKIIMNSVPIANLPRVFDLAGRDRWSGYAAQRTDIIEYIHNEDIEGVVWVAGDFHLAYAGTVAPSGPGVNQVEILAGPGGQFPNPLAAALRNQTHIDFATSANNYLTLELNPAGRRFTARWTDGSGMELGMQTYVV